MHLRSAVAVGLALALFGSQASTRAASPASENKRASRESLDVLTATQIAMPQSVFTVPSQSSPARNPFFPQSTVVAFKQPPVKKPDDISSLLLDGITSPPRRTAMINGRTFEIGEAGEVKPRAGGKVWMKCIEIKSDSAVIEVDGQRHELRLRPGVN